VSVFPADTAAAQGLATCHTCAKVAPASLHRCPRCGASIHLRMTDSLARTVALVLTACILYIPANILPIMTTDQLGSVEPSTIIGGVVLLWDLGSYPVAAVIFIASVMVPTGKMVSILYLCWTVGREQKIRAQQRTVMYRITEFVGRWSMVDVFVVAILVALIQLGGLLSIQPGAAALAFSGVVIITMLAAESFDPRLIWDIQGDDDE
jgi:paraquat-inducible protein A